MRPRVFPERMRPTVKARVRRARFRVRQVGESRRKAVTPKAARPKRWLTGLGARKARPR